MQIFVKIISTQDQMRTRRRRSSARSLPRKSTRPPARSLPGMTAMSRKDPCRDHGKTLAKDISGATARRAPAKAPPPFPCSCQPSELGAYLCGDVRPLGQLSKHLCGGLQIFMKTLPPRQISSLPAYMAPHASLAWARVEARRSGDGRDGPRSRPR